MLVIIFDDNFLYEDLLWLIGKNMSISAMSKLCSFVPETINYKSAFLRCSIQRFLFSIECVIKITLIKRWEHLDRINYLCFYSTYTVRIWLITLWANNSIFRLKNPTILLNYHWHSTHLLASNLLIPTIN